MAIEKLTTTQELAPRFLRLLWRNWSNLLSLDDFAELDEDDQVEYLVNFRADMSHYFDLRRQADSGELEAPELARLADLERLIEQRTPEYERMVDFDG